MGLRSVTVRALLALGLFLFFPRRAAAEPDFVIGGNNSNEAIQRLTQINGLSIKEIEARSRPCDISPWPDCSIAGFLGRDESLIERLIIDNTYVHAKKLTHMALAKPLYALRNLPSSMCKRTNPKRPTDGGQCEIHGRTYTVTMHVWKGFQESVFNDGYRSNVDVEVTDGNGKTITYSEMLAPYIERYGFYEGQTPLRLAPETIIQMFHL